MRITGSGGAGPAGDNVTHHSRNVLVSNATISQILQNPKESVAETVAVRAYEVSLDVFINDPDVDTFEVDEISPGTFRKRTVERNHPLPPVSTKIHPPDCSDSDPLITEHFPSLLQRIAISHLVGTPLGVISNEWDFGNFTRSRVEKALEHFQHNKELSEAIITD